LSLLLLLLAAAAHKGHELKAAQSLLADEAVSLAGCTVSADALHCQQQSAQIITQQKGGHYLLAVKTNQPTLAARAQAVLAVEVHTPFLSTPTAAGGGSKSAV